MSKGLQKREVVINMAHLDTACKFINTHNTHIKDALSQDEVLNFMIESWEGDSYLTPLRYCGVILFPERIMGDKEGEDVVIVHVQTLADFSSSEEDMVSVSIAG